MTFFLFFTVKRINIAGGSMWGVGEFQDGADQGLRGLEPDNFFPDKTFCFLSFFEFTETGRAIHDVFFKTLLFVKRQLSINSCAHKSLGLLAIHCTD